MSDQLDFSRRQIIRLGAAIPGLFALSGASSFVLGEEVSDLGLKGLGKLPPIDKSKLPFIGLTDEGPFYPPGDIPWLRDLTQAGPAGTKPDGQIMYLFGRILDAKGNPLEGVTVEIWHADNHGRYKHPRAPQQNQLDASFSYYGKAKTAIDGSYLFKSIMPRWYQLFDIQRANHVHLRIRHKDHGVMTTQMYFDGAEQDKIRSQDRVYQAHPNAERLIIHREKPEDYSDLAVKFEKDAMCCRYDLAYFF